MKKQDCRKLEKTLKTSTRVLLEVTVVFAAVIGLCKILYAFRDILFVTQTLPILTAALFLYATMVLLYLMKKKARDWGITITGFFFSIKKALVLFFLLLSVYVSLLFIYRHFLFQSAIDLTFPSNLTILLIYQFLCIALPEEVFYRGYMQSSLNEIFTPDWKLVLSTPSLGFGWIYTAFLFALGHYLITFNIITLWTFFFGLLLGWLREWTGGIVAPIVLHALFNVTILLLQ